MTRDKMLSYTAEDINNMDKQQLLELARAERKAIKDARYRLKQSDVQYSPAQNYLEETGNISAKESMTVNELREQVTRGRVILNYQTLYVGDAREVETKMLSSMSERLGAEISPEESKAMWDIIKKIGEEEPALLNTPDIKYIPKETQQRVYNTMIEYKQSHRQRGKGISKYRMNQMYKTALNTLKSDYRERERGASKQRFYEVDDWEEDF